MAGIIAERDYLDRN